MQNIKKYLENIKTTNKEFERQAKNRLDFLAKPIDSLGELENISKKLCGIFETLDIKIDKKAIIIFSSDNGIYEENVASTPQNVTAIQTVNIAENKTGVGVLAKHFNVDLIVCDIGIKDNIFHEKVINKKISKGTKNFLKEKAMNREQLLEAINIGIELAQNAIKDGYRIIGVGEMGIANTSTSSAVLASLLNLQKDDIADVVGKGAGLSQENYNHKIKTIQKAIEKHRIDNNNVYEILETFGGYDIAGMTGVFIACAYNKIPFVIDGFIAIVALLCAKELNPLIEEYAFLSHYSMEKGYKIAKNKLNLNYYLNLEMKLGEGSGCPIMFCIMESAVAIFKNMATFDEANINTKYLENLK